MAKGASNVVATPGPQSETIHASPLPGEGARAVVPWFPAWAREFAEQYFAGTTCLFVMHGNVHDLTLQEPARNGATAASPTFWRPSSSAVGMSSCGMT